MYVFFTILIILVCAFLTLLVLIQKPKGSGLSSGFSGLNSMMGVHRTTNEVERWTWYLSISLFVLAVCINFFIDRGVQSQQSGSELQDRIEQVPVNVPQVNPQDAGDVPTP